MTYRIWKTTNHVQSTIYRVEYRKRWFWPWQRVWSYSLWTLDEAYKVIIAHKADRMKRPVLVEEIEDCDV